MNDQPQGTEVPQDDEWYDEPIKHPASDQSMMFERTFWCFVVISLVFIVAVLRLSTLEYPNVHYWMFGSIGFATIFATAYVVSDKQDEKLFRRAYREAPRREIEKQS